jgi:anti-sigma regulatory factor (Ser/Thr protein kinase)
VTRRFDRKASEVGHARRFVRSRLEAWGLGAQATPLELAVSELVTNALVHGEGTIQVTLRSEEGQVGLEVTDEGRPSRPPGPIDAGRRTGGWGLHLVDQLADRWGSVTDPDRTRVWMTRSSRDHSPG